MRDLSLTILLLLAAFVTTADAADDPLIGVFSNEGTEFSTATLVIHTNGFGLFLMPAAGAIGEWTFDKRESLLSFKTFDPSGKGETMRLRFNGQQRSYTVLGPDNVPETRPESTLHFDTNQIPPEMIRAFKEFPEKLKEMRAKYAAQEQAAKESAKRHAEQMEEERPEYERVLSRIKNEPRTALSKELHARELTPATRAFRTSLQDKEVKFPEAVLVALLEQLPDDNYWDMIFARPELSAGTIEKFYPRALKWGKENYGILANIARHPNTPIAIVRDLAGREGLPVGATTPAKERLKKLGPKIANPLKLSIRSTEYRQVAATVSAAGKNRTS